MEAVNSEALGYYYGGKVNKGKEKTTWASAV